MRYQRRHDDTILRHDEQEVEVEQPDGTASAEIVETVAYIPSDEGNADYRRFLLDVEGGADVAELPEPPPDPSIATATEIRKQLSDLLDVHRTFLGKATPTSAEVVAEVKALARGQIRQIRLHLQKLDGTD